MKVLQNNSKELSRVVEQKFDLGKALTDSQRTWGSKWDRARLVYSTISNKLDRQLHKLIGKKWDDVYSYFIAKYPTTSLPLYGDIRECLKDKVEIDTIIRDKEIYSKNGWNSKYPISSGYYVDPTTKVLCHIPKPNYAKLRREARDNPTSYELENGDTLELRKGIWYSKHVERYHHFDYWGESSINIREHYKQLSKKDLKFYGLVND